MNRRWSLLFLLLLFLFPAKEIYAQKGNWIRQKQEWTYVDEYDKIITGWVKYKDWEITDKYFQLLEETIRRQPELYLWSHKRWKRTREEFNLRYDEKTGRVSLEPLDEIIRKKDKE